MQPLERILDPLVAMTNRQIAAKTPARELCGELEGRVCAVRVNDTALSVCLLVEDGRIVASQNYLDEPDIIISGSPIALARLSGPQAEQLIRDGDVEINGDVLVAEKFRKLLRLGQPDLEEELSGIVGDIAAHQVGSFFRAVGRWAEQATETLKQNTGEYFREESDLVPRRREADDLRRNVNTLRDDVARFEARLNELDRDSD